jgi:hypothetical protein
MQADCGLFVICVQVARGEASAILIYLVRLETTFEIIEDKKERNRELVNGSFCFKLTEKVDAHLPSQHI